MDEGPSQERFGYLSTVAFRNSWNEIMTIRLRLLLILLPPRGGDFLVGSSSLSAVGGDISRFHCKK